MNIFTQIREFFNREKAMLKSQDWGRTVTVKEGDTLSQIAKDHLGSADRAQDIFDLNSNFLSDPDHIYTGQVLRLPNG